jgi:hypothetical protein
VGGQGRGAALPLLEGDVLGGPRPRDRSRPTPRRAHKRGDLEVRPPGDSGGHPGARVERRGRGLHGALLVPISSMLRSSSCLS